MEFNVAAGPRIAPSLTCEVLSPEERPGSVARHGQQVAAAVGEGEAGDREGGGGETADLLPARRVPQQHPAVFDTRRLQGTREGWREREREMFYLTTHSTHFIYGYMASDIWLRTILIVRKETCCRHIGYSHRLTARVLLYAPSHRQDNTYHGLCHTSRGAPAGT